MWFLAPPCPADTYPRQPGIDVLHYTFRLTLRDETDEIAGESNHDIRFLQACLTTSALDLASPNSGGMTVSAVTARGVPVRYQHKGRPARHDRPPTKAGQRGTFTVALSRHAVRWSPDR
jgi:hypothetical protein